MNCLEFMRLRQEQGKLDNSIDLSDENIVLVDFLPIHRDMFSLMFHHSIGNGDVIGNVTSGDAVIAWTDRDGKIHTSNTDNHFLESEVE